MARIKVTVKLDFDLFSLEYIFEDIKHSRNTVFNLLNRFICDLKHKRFSASRLVTYHQSEFIINKLWVWLDFFYQFVRFSWRQTFMLLTHSFFKKDRVHNKLSKIFCLFQDHSHNFQERLKWIYSVIFAFCLW